MGDHDTVRLRLRAALRADDPWTALYALSTDRPAGLADAVEELYRSDADRAAFRPHLAWFLRSLGEPGDAVLLRLFAEPACAPADRQDLLRAAVARGLRLPAELLRAYGQEGPGIRWERCMRRRPGRPRTRRRHGTLRRSVLRPAPRRPP
ncbi:hypothetical protein [Streptomyces exfoliatus]|uniref:hypothetical protein n=1 Tax=Streptomyces exfoliatus TaxID=1905 RepID=UPI0004B2DA08|nr:hypothetical protein [Streptomyces exfoliatus]